MKKVLLITLLSITLFNCSKEDDTITRTSTIQKSNAQQLGPELVPAIGDYIIMDQIEDEKDPVPFGKIPVKILCRKITYIGIGGDDWTGVGVDAQGNYWIITSTVSMTIGDNNKPQYSRFTRGTRWAGLGQPTYPCD